MRVYYVDGIPYGHPNTYEHSPSAPGHVEASASEEGRPALPGGLGVGCTLELDADLLSELGEPLEDNRAGTGLLTEPVGPAMPRTRAMVASQLLLLGGVDAGALPSGVPPAPDRAMYSPKDSFTYVLTYFAYLS